MCLRWECNRGRDYIDLRGSVSCERGGCSRRRDVVNREGGGRRVYERGDQSLAYEWLSKQSWLQ